jgi:class III poly(R)-hydroxyalkanoic acid synthase PhaE subunit
MFQNLLPALGHTREYQEIARRMLDLSVRFQQRYADFMQQSNDIGQSALSAMQKRSDGTAPHSPAALYDAWIDCAEQAYAQAAHGEAFTRSLADLCNILSAFKIERGKMLEALARQLDLPSRAEVDSLHRQVRSLTDAVNRAASKPPKPKARKPREAPKPRKRTGK